MSNIYLLIGLYCIISGIILSVYSDIIVKYLFQIKNIDFKGFVLILFNLPCIILIIISAFFGCILEAMVVAIIDRIKSIIEVIKEDIRKWEE